MSPRVRQRKQRGLWEADFVDAHGNRRRPTAKTKREAEKLLEDGIAEKKRAQERTHGTPLSDDPMTFPRYVDRWLSMLTVEKKTLAGYRQYARLYITPKITKRVGSITPADVNDLLTELRQQYAPATVRQAKSVLTQVLSLAVLEGYLAANPVKSVQRVRSKKSKPKVRAMSREQRDRLLKETPEPYRALFALMAFSGLRPGEAYALELGDLDLETGIVRVERSISIYDQSVKGTKTGEERDVELSDRTVAGMKTHIWLNDTIIRKSGYLFASEAGTVLDHNNAAKQFARALKRAKLSQFSLYDLRHTYASLLLSEGAPLLYVQKQMGHSSAAVTLKYYSKWMPRADEERYVNRLDLEKPIWNQFPQVGEPPRNRTANLRIKSPSLHHRAIGEREPVIAARLCVVLVHSCFRPWSSSTTSRSAARQNRDPRLSAATVQNPVAPCDASWRLHRPKRRAGVSARRRVRPRTKCPQVAEIRAVSPRCS